MFKHTTIAIDIAKSSFHVVRIHNGVVTTDKVFNRSRLKMWLAKQKKAHVVIEACGSSHYWARYAISCGHSAQLIAPKHVTGFRQGHKTDQNDAMAIAIASTAPKVKSVAIKSVEQQALQSMERIRQHLVDNQTAVSNMIRGLLAEFGIEINKGVSAFKRRVPDILEDAENGLPAMVRVEMNMMYQSYQQHESELAQIDKRLAAQIKVQPQCKTLMALESIGPINALCLLLALGDNGASFNNGREAAACIGLTPKQYSTGGVVQLGGIGKKAGNKRLRANLIQGALSVVQVVAKRLPKNTKEAWLKRLIETKGKRRAAVALANKTVRTAWAMLSNNTQYELPKTA